MVKDNILMISKRLESTYLSKKSRTNYNIKSMTIYYSHILCFDLLFYSVHKMYSYIKSIST